MLVEAITYKFIYGIANWRKVRDDKVMVILSSGPNHLGQKDGRKVELPILRPTDSEFGKQRNPTKVVWVYANSDANLGRKK